MNILGISCFYHDAAAALCVDGKIVAAAEEERFTRRKHDFDFPKNAINFCLGFASLKVSDLDYIVFYEKPFIKMERLLLSYIATFPRSWKSFIASMPVWLKEKMHIPSIIQKETGFKGKIFYADHHISHAASSFLCSPFEEAAVFTLDGVGEWNTSTYGTGRGNQVELTHEINFPHSLGLLYSAFTGYLGFRVNDGEYKVMGMAPYGEPKYVDKVKQLVQINDDGSFRLNMDYFAYHYKLENLSRKFIELFGPPRPPESVFYTEKLYPNKNLPGWDDGYARECQRFADIAHSIQDVTEEAMLKTAEFLHRQTGMDYLCMAGGVALNCVANGEVLRKTPFKEIWIQPGAGDSGGAIGAALYVYNTVLGNPRNYVMNQAYLGPSFSEGAIKKWLDENSIPYKEFSEADLPGAVAKLIAGENVVGFYHGRMEFGPRALGARSILADPRNPKMKDILNEKIKHREQFRPFAPAVLVEKAGEYFNIGCTDAPYMLLVGEVRPDKRKLIPAVTHADYTARPQTVRREANPRYYDIIAEFDKLTGVPVIINTSFNVRGEPIVLTPYEAYRCFATTDMDYVVLERFIVSKKEIRPEHIPPPPKDLLLDI
ncbi:MAG: carbamoyltransferase [Candidatus Aureabacteria bacterium]|nr:carbamoyltransferase [Candidatus Auribacterota bacterium]